MRFSRIHALTCLLVAVIFIGALVTDASAKRRHPLTKASWLSRTVITEYYPVPESWFVGAPVDTPGLNRQSRVDWLYSARGMSMEGDGIGIDGKRYHIDNVGSSGWINRKCKRAVFGPSDANLAPFWRGSGYWRNRRHAVTFPLLAGGWFAGEGKRYVNPSDITFAAGPSRPLKYYRSVAVDPTLIPAGSIVFTGAYSPVNGDGWFRADDTGGAITGHHIDVYREPPARLSDTGRYFKNQRIFVVPANKVAAYITTERQTDTDGLPAPPLSLMNPPK